MKNMFKIKRNVQKLKIFFIEKGDKGRTVTKRE